MKLIDHIYAVKNRINRGIASDDSPFSNELIAHYLKVKRARLIENKADKYYFISDQSFQSLCIPLEEGSFHNCCDGPDLDGPDLDCHVLKSTYAIPKVLNTRWGDFLKVTTITGQVINKTSMTANSLAQYTITNKTPKTGWFIHDGMLYIVNNTKLELVLLNGLFSDPKVISDLNCSSGSNTCPGVYEEEFPIDADLIDVMYEMVITDLRNSLGLPSDNVNNAKAVEMANEKE